LLDRLTEPRRHFVGSRQRKRLVRAVDLLPKVELEVLDLLERLRLQRREVRRVDEDIRLLEVPQVAHDGVEVARGHARFGKLTPELCRVVLPLLRLTTGLTDLVVAHADRRLIDAVAVARSAVVRPRAVAAKVIAGLLTLRATLTATALIALTLTLALTLALS